MFVPGGQTFLAHRREGGTKIFTWRGGTNILPRQGGQTFYVGGEASKLSAGARIFRGLKGPEILVLT